MGDAKSRHGCLTVWLVLMPPTASKIRRAKYPLPFLRLSHGRICGQPWLGTALFQAAVLRAAPSRLHHVVMSDRMVRRPGRQIVSTESGLAAKTTFDLAARRRGDVFLDSPFRLP